MGPATPLCKKKLSTETRCNTAPGGREGVDQATGLVKDVAKIRKEVFTPMADLLTSITKINI